MVTVGVLFAFLLVILLAGCAGPQMFGMAEIEIAKDGGAIVTPEKPLPAPKYVKMCKVLFRPRSGPDVPWGDMLITAGLTAAAAAAVGFWLRSANVVMAILAAGGAIVAGMFFFATWLYLVVGVAIAGLVLWAFPSLIGSIKTAIAKRTAAKAPKTKGAKS